jgi:hypothetical protein
VRGIKITDYCGQEWMKTKDRLDLFIKACHAIQHAHKKGNISKLWRILTKPTPI